MYIFSNRSLSQGELLYGKKAEVKWLGKNAFLLYVVTAIAITVSCFAVGGGAAKRTKGDRMVNESKSAGKTTRAIDFEFRFTSVGGPLLGTDVRERQSLLKLDGISGTVLFEKHRSESDAEDEPIGLFHGALESLWFERLKSMADSLGLEKLPPSSGGGFGASLLTFEYRSDKQSYTKSITNFDSDQITTIEPLLTELYRMQAKLQDSAASAITTSVRHVNGGGSSAFVLTIRNTGRAPLYIADPRWLEIDNDSWAGVRIAILPSEVPGVTSPPLKWDRLIIGRPQGDRPANTDLLIQPGGEMSFPTEPWKPNRQGVHHLVQGVFSNYTGDGSIKGVYRIRGAAFSKAIEVTL